jgi:hypothetical protein
MHKQAGPDGAARSSAAARQGRTTALRLGWNDAAWGRPRREVDAVLAAWYERGYVGGLAFRRQRAANPPEVLYVPLHTADPPTPPLAESA